jgi:hypothetical protein
MAIGGSFNLPSKLRDAWDGWYYSYKCSLNFALLKRRTYLDAMYEYAGDFIQSGFQSENPADANGQGRYVLEVALERYIERHKKYTLCKVEDRDWTVFHTNTHEQRLKQVREKYRARKNVERFMNVGFSDAAPIPAKALYYGYPTTSVVKQLRVEFGESQFGPYWRSLKQRLSVRA